MLQHAGERYYLAVAPLVEAVVYALVVGVVGGAYPLQRAVLLSLADRHADKVESVVHLEFPSGSAVVAPESQEVGLRLLQGNLRLAHL